MSFLFGGGTNAESAPKVTGMRIQTSAYGMAIPYVAGQTRITMNLLWYGDFKSVKHKQSAGKGGGATSTTYTYSASLILGLCEGPIVAVPMAWIAKEETAMADTGFTVFLGSYPQAPWGYMETAHPGEALGYPGIACLAAPNYDLGNNPNLPLFNFEVAARLQNVPGQLDADPAEIVTDYLTDPYCGAGFPVSRLGTLGPYSDYCRAYGILFSPYWADQRAAGETLDEMVRISGAEIVWDGSLLDVIPYGDVEATANGATYVPPGIVAHLGTDDFHPADGDDPVKFTRGRPADAWNSVKLEIYRRDFGYNTDLCEAALQDAIEQYGLRADEPTEAHFITEAQVGNLCAHLKKQRLLILNKYEFRLGWKHIALLPMEIVTLTDTALQLVQHPVRIKEITEDEDGYLSCVAEDFIQGTGSAPDYPSQAPSGYRANRNVDPESVNTPVIFEPTVELTMRYGLPGPQIWAAVSGGPNWGGCDVWASTDGDSYKLIGTISAPARHGILRDAFPAGLDPDTVNTLEVDLSASLGTLTGGTQLDADQHNTLCWVDGEIVSYQSADLVAPNQYDLGTYIRRGLFGTAIAAHDAAAPFVRLDEAIFQYPYDPTLRGATLHFKFVSLSVWGLPKQWISGVTAYTFVPGGQSIDFAYQVIDRDDGTLVFDADETPPEPVYDYT